jgi:aminoglycoside phosphotransferase family enzyme/predicted kinase
MPARRASPPPTNDKAPRRRSQSGQHGQSQDDVVRFLSDPASYPGDVASVETIATHASMIFLAGELAYKLKRTVRYSYLDYSTPELRRRACEAELALNRRTAPSIYRSVASIRRTAAGALSFEGAGDVVDWVVVMRRFPQDALLSNLADRGLLTDQLILDLADRIAAFHGAASVEPGQGGVAGIDAVIRINDENLRRSPPADTSTADIDRLRDASAAALAAHAALLEGRRAAGRVRRCHGDLHLGNICLADGQPTLFDCIEFSDLIACTDVLYDLAFVLMDLRHRSLPQLCNRLFNRYIDLSGDEQGVPALPLFLSLRAAVRAHVTATAAQSAGGDRRHRQLTEARSYFDLASELLRPQPARLVAIGGLSGTGKSTIAAAVAGDLGVGAGARILRSDVVRKQLFGKRPEERLPGEAYAMAVNTRVYAAVEARAVRLLAAGHGVIIDAVSARPEERAAIADLARQAGAAFTGLWLEAPPDTLRARIAARGKDASDATVRVLDRQLSYDLGAIDWRRIDVDRPAGDILTDVRRALGG